MTALNFSKSNIIKLQTKFDNKLGYKLRLQLHSIFLFIGVNFDKSISSGLHFLFISSILTKFFEYQRSITISPIKCLNFKFFRFKIIYKK